MLKRFILLLIVFCAVDIYAQQVDYSALDGLLKKHVSSSGNVKYSTLIVEKTKINAIVTAFSKVDYTKLGKNDQLAFLINYYNIATIQLITQNWPLTSIQKLDNGKTWDVKRVVLNGSKVSLNDIENKLIRPVFKDARIHFALNCGAKSCPPILATSYKGATLDAQLNERTTTFVNNDKFNSYTSGKAQVSKIFDWYKVDFGDVGTYLNKYLKTKLAAKTPIAFAEYDWSVNGN
jgi:hypothetical protein